MIIKIIDYAREDWFVELEHQDNNLKKELYFMNEAYKEAVKAYKKGEVPIGAVIVRDGEIISRAHNEREIKQDATLHAEMTCIRKACKKLNTWRLNDCDIYSTLEPCPMCAGALIQARINKLYIGTKDPKGGAVGSVIDILAENQFNHKVEVVYGIMEEQCSAILKDFFRNLRAK